MNWKSLSWKFILLIFAAAVLFLWLIKAPVMSWYLTEKIKVPVSIGRISIWPSETTIHRFRVANPHGFKNRTALEAKVSKIDYQFSKLMGPVSEIDQIEIDDIFLSIDCSNPLCTSNNWTAIGDKMAKKEEKERNHRVVVHKLVLSNLNVHIHGLGIGQPPQTKRIARLEFHEIDSDKGFPTQKLIRAIFRGLGLEQYLKNAFNPQNAIKQFLPKLFGDGIQQMEE